MRRLGLLLCLPLLGCDDSAIGSRSAQDSTASMDFSRDGGDIATDASITSARVFFVAPAAEDGADGSRHRPFGDVLSAYAQTTNGDIVLLLPGRYGKVTPPPDGVFLQGSGAGATYIEGPLVFTKQSQGLREVTVTGGEVAITVSGTAVIEDVVIENAQTAIVVNGELTADRLTVTRIDGPDQNARSYSGPRPAEGSAIRVEAPGRLEMTASRLGTLGWTGLTIRGRAQLSQVSIGTTGGPAVVLDAGELALTNTRFDTVANAAILMLDGTLSGETVTVEDVQETMGFPLRCGLAMYGGKADITRMTMTGINRGIRLSAGADLEVRNVHVMNPRIDGISLDGARLNGGDLRIDEPANTGLSAVDGSEVSARSVSITAPGRIGVLIDSSTFALDGVNVTDSVSRGVVLQYTSGRLTDVTVENAGNVGIQLTDASGPLTIDGGRVTNNATSGIAVTGRSGDVHITGIVSEQTRVGEADLAEGLHIYQASVRLSNLVSRRNGGAGILAEFSELDATTLELSDNLGPGTVLVDTGENTRFQTVQAERNAGVGVLILQGFATLEDMVVRDTRTVLSAGPGDGISVDFGGRINLTRAESTGNQRHGVSVGSGSQADLSEVTATSNAGYGLNLDCAQSVVAVGDDCRFESNTRGAQPFCQ
ncbi:MAG: right-handed parallel beta-helix repeat-containing protein [Bradymonadia bacterium]